MAVDLAAAKAALDVAHSVVESGTRKLSAGSIDDQQVLAYDLAHAAAAVRAGESMLIYADKGDVEAKLTVAFIADVIADVAARLLGREELWGVDTNALNAAHAFAATYRDPAFLAGLALEDGPRHLDEDFIPVQDVFRKFAEEKVRPLAEGVHRSNGDIPEDLIQGLAELGVFGMSVPEEYDGFSSGGENEYLGMIVATEELSRGSLGIGGSLITRPEILTRALLAGGTEEQKQEWLPKLASAEVMAAVAVTEPDYGSDVAGIKVAATRTDGGWLINGTKTWCTFAGRADALMLLARTDPDRSLKHKGLSLFVVPKQQAPGHEFDFTDEHGGTMSGRAIDTIGYRGMHSYEVAFENWFVPDANLVGGEDGLGKGFFMQMAGFENGRLQTAARAVGVMQAAYEAAREYASSRHVFGSAIGDYQLTQVKLARMAFMIQACRQFSYEVGRLMAKGEGVMEAAMVKAYACRAAEWVTREAMQIHGGFGYAEEYVVSRYFVDARVLSIFEGADETLCLKVIARRLNG